MIPVALLLFGGGTMLFGLSSLVSNVKTNPMDMRLLMMLQDSYNQLERAYFVQQCIGMVLLALVCFLVYNQWRGHGRNIVIVHVNGQMEDIIEDIINRRGGRRGIAYGEHIRYPMIQGVEGPTRGRHTSDSVYRQQRGEGLRLSQEEKDRNLAEQIQLRELSKYHQKHERRPRDIRQRKNSSNTSRNKQERPNYFPTYDKEDNYGITADSLKEQNDFTNDGKDVYNGIKMRVSPFYKSACGVDDFTRTYQDYPNETSYMDSKKVKERKEKKTAPIYDDDANLDLREREEIEMAIAMSLSLEDQNDTHDASETESHEDIDSEDDVFKGYASPTEHYQYHGQENHMEEICI